MWADVAQQRHRLRALHEHLTAAECERAARFHLAADRERFVVGRGLLREILGRQLRVAPPDLVKGLDVAADRHLYVAQPAYGVAQVILRHQPIGGSAFG